jgi:hypothetical protein
MMVTATHKGQANGQVPMSKADLEAQLAGLNHQERVAYLGRLLQDMQPKPQPVPQTPPAPPSPTGSNGSLEGRDKASGRFTAGNRCSKGNPFAKRQYALRSGLLAAVTEETLTAMAAKLVELALAGDVAAAALLFSYVLGKPARMVDLLDLEARQLSHAGGDEHGNMDD